MIRLCRVIRLTQSPDLRQMALQCDQTAEVHDLSVHCHQTNTQPRLVQITCVL